jgi:two-component system response regulator RegA
MKELLLLEDDYELRNRLSRSLSQKGFSVTAVPTVAEARASIAKQQFQYATLDQNLSDGTGLDLIEPLRKNNNSCAIVILTGFGSIPQAVHAVHCGAVDYLMKPITVARLIEALTGVESNNDREADEPPTLSRLEWEYMHRVLDDCGGNISKAAKILGLHRRTLQRKLQKSVGGE